MKEKLAARFGKFDKDGILKWGFLIGAGVLTLISNVFDTRKKDRQFKDTVDKKVDAKLDKLIEESAKPKAA